MEEAVVLYPSPHGWARIGFLYLFLIIFILIYSLSLYVLFVLLKLL